MLESWEITHTRGQQTIAVWNQYAPNYQVGKLTLAEHTTDVQSLPTQATTRDEQEDVFDEAVIARDENLALMRDLNVRVPQAIEGNLEPGAPLLLELRDIYAVQGRSAARILERTRKVVSLWTRVNAARAAANPPLAALEVGDYEVAELQAALTNHEPLLAVVEREEAGWGAAKDLLRQIEARVDKNNKRWYKAWMGNFAEGSPERNALSQITTESTPPSPVEQAVISQAAYVPSGDKVHLDFDAEHATSFKVLRQAPGQTALTVIAPKVEATSYDDEDVETGSYTYQVIGHNSGGDGPPSATVTVAVS